MIVDCLVGESPLVFPIIGVMDDSIAWTIVRARRKGPSLSPLALLGLVKENSLIHSWDPLVSHRFLALVKSFLYLPLVSLCLSNQYCQVDHPTWTPKLS